MADFKCEVVKIEIREHFNADSLELAVIGGGVNCIVGKGQYQTGDLVVYIPADSLVPQPILEELNLVGKLAGKNGDRVKAMRLRGVVSEGLVYPIRDGWSLGDDVTDELGITKYEPPVPSSLAGEVEPKPELTYKYDFSNLFRVPDIFDDMPVQEIAITEKLHGSFCGITIVDEQLTFWSKGLGSQGLVFKNNEQNLKHNSYMKTVSGEMAERLVALATGIDGGMVQIFGEVFGPGIQDLHYGLVTPTLRIFDIRINHAFLPHTLLRSMLEKYELTMVPTLYLGELDLELANELANGKETLSGEELHIREGIVIKSTNEMLQNYHPMHGRRIAKIVSDEYKMRKGGTEYN